MFAKNVQKYFQLEKFSLSDEMLADCLREMCVIRQQ